MELAKIILYEIFAIIEICIQSLFFILFIFVLLIFLCKKK